MRAKSAITRKQINIDHDIDHQNQKSKILDEDRKLFLRQAEEIKDKCKEEIEKLKGENKKLKNIRDQFIASKKNKSQLRTAYNTSFGQTGTKFTITNTDENFLRIALDKEKHETKIKKNILFNLQDKLKEVEDNKLGYIEESPLMRNIRILENRLDKVMIKYNEAQSIQQTYQQVVKRLKEERVGYDSQLAAVETCLKGKEHDFQELLLLAHDATHAKEAAYAELKRYEQRRLTVQEIRTKYVTDKKDQINKDASQVNQTASKNEKKNFNPKATAIFTNNYKHDENYQRQELNDYEEAFRKLKEVTGVIDANEIIQKFKTQGLTTSSLEELKESYRKKIQDLKEEKQQLKKILEENKFIKQREGPERRRLDEVEEDSAKITNQYQRTNIKYSKLSTSLINIKAGIQHLKDLTIFYKRDGENTVVSLEDDLKNLNEKLRRMYDAVKQDPNYMKQNYKVNTAVIQNMMNEHADYRGYQANDQEDDENSEDDQ